MLELFTRIVDLQMSFSRVRCPGNVEWVTHCPPLACLTWTSPATDDPSQPSSPQTLRTPSRTTSGTGGRAPQGLPPWAHQPRLLPLPQQQLQSKFSFSHEQDVLSCMVLEKSHIGAESDFEMWDLKGFFLWTRKKRLEVRLELEAWRLSQLKI